MAVEMIMEYYVCEIAGKQYLVKPGQIFLVNKLGLDKEFVSDKVVLSAKDGKIEVGQPYLAEKLKFEVLGDVKGKKIRVATYKAKSNYRRVKGFRSQMTKLKLLGMA